jgi:hypothetical protein
VDDSEDVYLALLGRSIDLEQHTLLALAIVERARLKAYQFLIVLFASMLDFFTERASSRSSTQAILSEAIDRRGEDQRVFGKRGKGFSGPSARTITKSKALEVWASKLAFIQVTMTLASIGAFDWLSRAQPLSL